MITVGSRNWSFTPTFFYDDVWWCCLWQWEDLVMDGSNQHDEGHMEVSEKVWVTCWNSLCIFTPQCHGETTTFGYIIGPLSNGRITTGKTIPEPRGVALHYPLSVWTFLSESGGSVGQSEYGDPKQFGGVSGKDGQGEFVSGGFYYR